MTREKDSGDPELVERIRAEILARGPISFARFMELALYDPAGGYYATAAERIGTRGDYFTASDVGNLFARAMARQVAEVDRLAGPFSPLHVVEFGAGRGLLARDLVDALAGTSPELASRLRYVAVDRGAAMREACRRLLPEATVLAPEASLAPFRGCVLAVELFDALPVHRVRRRGGQLVEVVIAVTESGTLVERETPASPEVRSWAERYGAAAEEGMEAEVSLTLGTQLELMTRSLEHGVVIVVDYGDPADRLYTRERRRGTLLAYHGHRTSEDLLARVGRQDLTAHVNFTALEDQATARGLTVLGRTTQDRFLIGNGLLEVFEQSDLASARDPRRARRRLQAMQLIHPQGMGRTFRVVVFYRGPDPAPALSGLVDPFR